MLWAASLALFAPLLGAIINGVFGHPFREKAHWPAVVAVGISMLASWWILGQVGSEPVVLDLYTWIPVANFVVPFGFYIDSLTAVMMGVVTTVSFLVHVYSIGYMHGDPGYRRYFAYLNLFVFSMLLLVLANNYALLFVGWEAVGLCSYLLIGFWYEKKSASDAGKKAFIVNRIGDAGFLLGIFTLFATFGSVRYDTVFQMVASNPHLYQGALVAATLFLFLGAVGKSAQFPLYVWLPDAMEGPTPVSALIHAATMVTAGVYMVARSHLLYSEVPQVGQLVASVGAFTALFAATMAMVNDDIKRVLAYSTISQLGYMFVAVGLGAYTAGIFHLYTHAFFKGLLFLAAGSVMHATHGELNMQKMGGFFRKMPHTAWTFLIGALALSGLPPLAGFFSKDEIIKHAYVTGHTFIWAVAVLTALLTAFYMFRLIFLVFFGKPRDAEIYAHLHESPPVMTVPLWILAAASVGAGWVGIGEEHSVFHRFLETALGEFHLVEWTVHRPAGAGLIALSVGVALLGILLAYSLYLLRKPDPALLARRAGFLYTLLKRKYYVDEIYNLFVVGTLRVTARVLFWGVDRALVDGTVNGTGWTLAATGSVFRRWSSGFLRSYLLWILIGANLLVWFLLRSGGGH